MNHTQSAETLGDLQGILNHQAINCIYTHFLGSFFKSATIRLGYYCDKIGRVYLTEKMNFPTKQKMEKLRKHWEIRILEERLYNVITWQ